MCIRDRPITQQQTVGEVPVSIRVSLTAKITVYTLRLLGNKAAEKGGGIHAISSLIKVDNPGSSVQFTANDVNVGGGVSLEVNAKLYILKSYYSRYSNPALFFTANSAYYGGAVYVADETNSGTCDSTSYGIHSTLTECSMQTLAIHNEVSDTLAISINFTDNHAHISGSTLFGGLLDRCTVSPFAEVYNNRNRPAIINGITYLQNMSTFTESSSSFSINSHPVRVCFCRDGQPCLLYTSPSPRDATLSRMPSSA